MLMAFLINHKSIVENIIDLVLRYRNSEELWDIKYTYLINASKSASFFILAYTTTTIQEFKLLIIPPNMKRTITLVKK
jgi:hypothetical protein